MDLELQPLFTYYEVLGNVDQTEGKGGYIVKRVFAEEQAAVDWAGSREGRHACGVMGHGYGKVTRIDITNTGSPDRALSIKRTDVWGYRNPTWKSTTDYGYLDMRDAPTSDPEYRDYMRLKAKFEGK